MSPEASDGRSLRYPAGFTPRRVKLFTIAAVVVMCVWRLFAIVNRYSVNILLGDQWVFDDATLFQKHSLLEIFRWQHGPHRQGLGGLLSKLTGPAIHWNSRYESFGIATILCLSAILAIWLKQRLFGKMHYSDVVIPLFFLTPAQYEVMLGPANPSHGPLPVLLFVIYCLGLTVENDVMRYGIILPVNILLIYTGFGLFVGFLTPVITAREFFRSRKRVALAATAIALLSLASFWVGYHFNPAADCFSPGLQTPVYYALFMAFMFSSFGGILPAYHLVAAIFAGTVLLAIIVGVCAKFIVRYFREHEYNAATTVIFSLLSYSLIFAAATAYGRVCLGLGAAQGSRYMAYLVLCFFGLYLAALSVRRQSERFISALLMLIVALGSSVFIPAGEWVQMRELSHNRRAWKMCYLSTRNIAQCDSQTHFAICWTPEPADLQQKLDMLEQQHWNLYSDPWSQP